MKRFLTDTFGATAIEYALIASLIAIACIVGIAALGGSTSGLMTNVQTEVSNNLR